jgi:hypothetical protein
MNLLISILEKLEFKWKKCQLKRKICTDRDDSVSWCNEYVVKIYSHQDDEDFVFLDDTQVEEKLDFFLMLVK